MRDYTFIAFVTWLFLCPFVPAVWFAFHQTEKRRLAVFLILQVLSCLFVGLVCFYLGEVAPSQGVVASKVFSGEDPGVIGAWTAVQWIIRLVGLLLSVSLAWKTFGRRATRQFLDNLIVALVCATMALVAPYLMSQLVGTIRDAFLLSK